MVPDGMTSQVHTFEPHEGGVFRITLTYDAPTATGKTTAQSDTYHGRFVKLVGDEQVVEVVEFESANSAANGARQTRGARRDRPDVEQVMPCLHRPR
jgi:hypothetical protein